MTTELPRTASVRTRTVETSIALDLRLDGRGAATIHTGLPFLDHMLTALALHARFDLEVRADGDLAVDDHHTAEDVALALGQALHQALGERRGLCRFGHAYVPLDEALARAVVDLSGRPWPSVRLDLRREHLGTIATENLTHFLTSLAIAGRFALHVDVLAGGNDHHKVEAAFKALAVALRRAVARDGELVPSTKGALA